MLWPYEPTGTKSIDNDDDDGGDEDDGDQQNTMSPARVQSEVKHTMRPPGVGLCRMQNKHHVSWLGANGFCNEAELTGK